MRASVFVHRWALGAAIATAACGYRPLRSGLAGHPRVRVERTVIHGPTADTEMAESAENGARAELARFGALTNESGAEVDTLTVEIVRVDERSEGVGVDGEDRPRARGIRVRITARGTVNGHGQSFETSDLDAFETVATTEGSLAWDGARTAAARTAARRVGGMVARETLGIP